MATNTDTPSPTLSGSTTATRFWITPSASSFWMRFQQGVEDSPTRLPTSATESEASCCSTPRILRSMASMPKSFGKRDKISSLRRKIEQDPYLVRISVIIEKNILFQERSLPRFAMSIPSTVRFLRPFVVVVLASLAFMAVAHAENVAPLVSTSWLKAHLKDPDVFVLDIRSAIDGGGVEAYQKGHIPTAIHS